MRFSPSTILFGAAPLAALTLFAGFSNPDSSTGVAETAPLVPQPAHFDIRPGTCPNFFEVHQSSAEEFMCVDGAMIAIVPMSILGNKFDVDQVHLPSVGLSRLDMDDAVFIRPLEAVFHDTGTPFEGSGCDCHGLGGDGKIDLDLKFSKQEMIEAFRLADEETGATVRLQISGIVEKDSSEFTGRDCLRIVNHH